MLSKTVSGAGVHIDWRTRLRVNGGPAPGLEHHLHPGRPTIRRVNLFLSGDKRPRSPNLSNPRGRPVAEFDRPLRTGVVMSSRRNSMMAASVVTVIPLRGRLW